MTGIDKHRLNNLAAEAGIELCPAQLERFEIYARFLLRENEKINLTAIKKPDDVVVKHFFDSLLLLAAAELPNQCGILDVGSGAGFPGVPCLIARPDIKLTCFEPTGKRADFLQRLSDALEIRFNVVQIRAEDAGRNPEFREKFSFVTARAVAPLQKLAELCVPLVCIGGIFAPMKGSGAADEISKSCGAFELLSCELKETKSFCLPGGDERNIIIIKKISSNPPNFPRQMAKISKSPL